MSEDTTALDDLGRCRHCGGRITATHMLTHMYELDERGSWRRHLDEFWEDVIVVCSRCNRPASGTFEVRDGEFRFLPEDRSAMKGDKHA
ncbi:MAG TPA: hypothetical protein VNM91_12610 [Dehalococcoidia bacterium]|nr:hypothetical protein [Dehalococcoidia bacterium]